MGFSVKDPIRGSITGNAGTVNNHTVNSDVPANAKFTDTTYESKAAVSGGTDVSLVTTGEKYTWNNKGSGTITKVQANGTDVASSGTANIPAASTSAYGVIKLSSATDSTSEALAATPKAVKAAYDLAAGKGTGTITGVSVNGTSVATSGVANITSVPASILNGAIPSAVTATTQSASDNSTKIATTAFVQTAIDNLPEPMVFKGSLGTGGTITALPTNGTANIGDTYKVITAGTYASKTAKIGDTYICLTKTSSANTWELIPSGDEPSGTVTSVTIKATSPISIDSSSAITTSGTRTLSHATSGVTEGTYRSVTVNATGHITAGTNPTTISGYGITDAKIASGTITLGSNTITPLTNNSTLDATKLSGTIPSGCYTDTKNTAGSTNTSGKIYLIGATSQAANPQTYSNNVVYAEDGTLAAHKTEIGVNVQANGNYSAVFGMNTRANGAESFSQGVGSYAQGDYSHAEGYQTISNGNGTHTEGYHTVAIGNGAHAENGSSYTRSIKITGGANATTYTTTDTNGAKIGNYLEYNGTIRKITNLAQNTSVTVEATFSSESLTNQTVFLTSTTASGTGAHAEGGDTLALGSFSHTEGWDTKTTGSASHAEGSGTTASETATHAEGSATIASGASSHAEGINTQGEYNILDSSGTTTTRGTYVHIVGNGTADNARSNAHTLDWSGNAWFAGDVYVGSTSGTNKDAGSKKLITADEIATSINTITPAAIAAMF